MGAPQPLLGGGSSRGCGGCPAPRSGCSHGDCHEEEESDSGNVQPEPAGERRVPSGNVERDQDAPDREADLSSGSRTELPQALPRGCGLQGQLCTALSLSLRHCPMALPAPTAPARCLGQLIPQTIPIKLLWQQKWQRWGGKTPLLRGGGGSSGCGTGGTRKRTGHRAVAQPEPAGPLRLLLAQLGAAGTVTAVQAAEKPP